MAKHKVTGEERVLQESQVNDMETNDKGEVIVFDTEMEPHYLLDGQGNVVLYTKESAE
jgi:hypothetical protein